MARTSRKSLPKIPSYKWDPLLSRTLKLQWCLPARNLTHPLQVPRDFLSSTHSLLILICPAVSKTTPFFRIELFTKIHAAPVSTRNNSFFLIPISVGTSFVPSESTPTFENSTSCSSHSVLPYSRTASLFDWLCAGRYLRKQFEGS